MEYVGGGTLLDVLETSPGCAVVLISTAVGWAGAPAAAFLQQQQ